MATAIHPTAIVDPKAQLGVDVAVGPYSIIGPDVILGDRVKVHSHALVEGFTTMGEDCQVYPFAAIGTEPQDKKYHGEASRLEVGARTTFREHATAQPGTAADSMVTKIGDDCLIMIGCHVAHDCVLGNNVIMVNNSGVSGHVVVEDFAIIGGLSGVHQFVRIGTHAMIGGMTPVAKDVLPYSMVSGERAKLQGLNLIGLKRRNFSREEIGELKETLATLTTEMTLDAKLAEIESNSTTSGVREVLEFIRASGNRGLTLS